MSSQRTFVVVEAHALVRVDLVQALLEACPGAMVLPAASAAQALALLAGIDRLDGAFVDLRADVLTSSGLAARIEALGGWIVCLGGRQGDDIRGQGWLQLVSPFSTDDVVLLLRTALGIRTGC